MSAAKKARFARVLPEAPMVTDGTIAFDTQGEAFFLHG